MELKDFAKVDENGGLVLDDAAFNKALNSFVDSSVSKAVDTAKTNWEKKANEAKLSEEEKLAQARQEFEIFMRDEKKKINQEKAKAKLTGKNFTKEEIEVMLEAINDDESSLKSVDIFVAQRDKVLADYKQKLIEEMQTKQAPTTPVPSGDEEPTEHKTQKPSRRQILENYV